MCCKSWKTFFPFLATFIIGSFITISIQNMMIFSKSSESQNRIYSEKENNGRSGGNYCFVCKDGTILTNESENPLSANSKSLTILFKPRANYTDAARTNQTQGTVTLRVVFLASGEIGDVSTVSALPDGLTEECIKAAKKIKFEPAKQNGKSVTVTKQVQYSFSLY